MRIVWSLLVLLGLAACGDAPEATPTRGPWPSAEARTMEAGKAPTPFTAAQIQQGCPEGRVATFRVIQPGREPFLQTMRFRGPDDEGVEVEMAMMLEDGTPISTPAATRSTWTELQAHASFPVDRTTITEDEITVEAGTFAGFDYQVRVDRSGEPPATTRAFFARDLPGPPIRMVKTVANVMRLQMELVSNVVEVGD